MKKTILDKLDRVVIPKDICRMLNLTPGSPVLFEIEDGKILIIPENVVCALCGAKVMEGTSVRLCCNCITRVNELSNSAITKK